MTGVELLKHDRAMGNPVVEGETVTFLWQSRSAPHLIDDLHGWEEHPQALQPVAPGL